MGYSVEKSPHSSSLFCWWTTLARRAEGQTAEITTADEACDSEPRPFCLDNYSQHRKPWKHTGSWKWGSMGMNGHKKFIMVLFFRLLFLRKNCLHWVTTLFIKSNPIFNSVDSQHSLCNGHSIFTFFKVPLESGAFPLVPLVEYFSCAACMYSQTLKGLFSHKWWGLQAWCLPLDFCKCPDCF